MNQTIYTLRLHFRNLVYEDFNFHDSASYMCRITRLNESAYHAPHFYHFFEYQYLSILNTHKAKEIKSSAQ